MKRLETNIIMYMTEALSARNVMQKKSEFQLSRRYDRRGT